MPSSKVPSNKKKSRRKSSLEKPADQSGDTSLTTRSPEKPAIQANLCSYLKAVYFSKDEGSIKKCVEDTRELFLKISKAKTKVKAFFQELQFRMDFLIDNKQNQTCRVRCIRAISLCTVRLYNEGKPELLNYLVEYSKRLSNADSATVRLYICVMVGLLFKNLGQCDSYLVFVQEQQYRDLFSVLKDRWTDVSPMVRREAIRSLAHIQDDDVSADHEDAVEKSPKEMLMTSLGDSATECREEAIKCLTITDSTQIKLILARIQKDTEWQVKKRALTKILSIEDAGAITCKERMDILEHLFKPSQHFLSEMLNELLIHWVRLASTVDTKLEVETQDEENAKSEDYTLFSGTITFARQLDPVKKEEICEQALIMAIKSIAEQSQGLANFVQTLSCDKSSIIHRGNYKLLLRLDIPLAEKTFLFFHWRCLIELCHLEYENREDQKSICMNKLAPTLQTFAEFANEFVELFADSPNAPSMSLRANKKRTEEEQRKFCLVQMFRIFHFLEEEPTGMKSWKDLLFHILSNTNIRLYPELVQEVAESIVHVHFAQGSDSEAQALHEFCDVINIFVQRAANPNCSSQINDTISFAPVEETEGQPAEKEVPFKMDDVTRGRALIIFNAMLRTGKFRKLTAELQGLYESIFPSSYTSTLIEERSLALECLGIVCMMDESWAEANICMFERSLTLDLTMVKLTCICTLSDLVCQYGQAKMTKWYQGNEEEEINRHRFNENSLINTVTELTASKEPEIAFRAAETLSKWCLSVGEPTEWRKELLHLLTLSFRAESQENLKMKACLARFFPVFAAISRNNQILLAEVLIDALNMLKERDLQSSLTSINEASLASYITNLTSFNLLHASAEDKEKGSAHSHLASLVLSALQSNADTYFASVYCTILGDLELNDKMDVDDLNNLLFACTDLLNENTSENVKDMKNIQQFLKRLTYLREKVQIEPASASRPESAADGVSSARRAIREMSVRTPTHQKPKTSRMPSSKKKRPSVATLTNQLGSSEKSADRSGLLPPTALRFRPRMNRAAKAHHRFYTADQTITEENDDEQEVEVVEVEEE